MPEPESDPEKDTLYPVSPVGDPHAIQPPPLSSELKARLDEIGKQDVARH